MSGGDWYVCPECERVVRGAGKEVRKCGTCDRRLVALDSQPPEHALLAWRLTRLAGRLADYGAVGILSIPFVYMACVGEATARTGVVPFVSLVFGWAGIAGAIYYVIPTAIWGQTAGKWLVGTKVVGPDGGAPGPWRALVRGLVSFVADNALCIGLLDPLWLMWDRHRQCLHDKAAGTVVVLTRRANPVAMLLAGLGLGVGLQVALTFLVIRPLLVQAYYVPSGSMLPTLKEQDRLLVNKLSFSRAPLQRGDVVVFRAPPQAFYGDPSQTVTGIPKKDFIKRVVAVGGDEVKVEDGSLWLKTPGDSDFRKMREPHIAEAIRSDWGPETVPDGQVVVMGDNRNNSNDSTKWVDAAGNPSPFLPVRNIRGRAFTRYWPLPRLGDIEGGTLEE